MFNVSTVSHTAHKGDSPIFAKRIPALRLAEPYHVKFKGAPLASIHEFTHPS